MSWPTVSLPHPNTGDDYRVRAGWRDESRGSVRTAPVPGPRTGFRFGATGDQRGELAPYPSVRNAKDRKLYRTRRHGDDAAIFVLDARSFRDQPLTPVTNIGDPNEIGAFLLASFDPSRTMLGQVQLAERHATIVNNLLYQTSPTGPQLPTTAFENITDSVAFDAPFGPSLIDIGTSLGLVTPAQRAAYDTAPRAGKDAFLQQLIDATNAPFGYPAIGLDNTPIQATLSQGGYVATHTFGWTEFDIDETSRELTVTTWGIEPFSEAELNANPAAITSRQPVIVSSSA